MYPDLTVSGVLDPVAVSPYGWLMTHYGWLAVVSTAAAYAGGLRRLVKGLHH